MAPLPLCLVNHNLITNRLAFNLLQKKNITQYGISSANPDAINQSCAMLAMLSRPRGITQLCAGYLWCDLRAVEAGARGCVPSSPVESRCSAEGHSDREDPCLNRRVFDIHQMILFQAQRETKCIYIIASLFLSLAALSSSACASGCTRTCVGFFFFFFFSGSTWNTESVSSLSLKKMYSCPLDSE